MNKSIKWLPEDYNETDSENFKRPFHMFLLKATTRCNLDCSYCYIYQSPDKSWEWKPKFLEENIVKKIAQRIQDHVEEHKLCNISIVFHGGEPLLAGINRLRNYIEILLTIVKCPIEFGMQTNGILLSPQSINLFFEYNFRVGISIDGSKENNDRNRLYSNKRSSYFDTVSGIKLFQSYPNYKKVLGGVLVVIDINNDPKEVLKGLIDLGIEGANLLLPDNNYEALPFRPYDDMEIYGKWLYDFFALWFENYPNLEIPYFEEIISMMLGGISSSEEIGAKSVDFIVIDTNGEIEAVDTLKMVGREATQLNLNVEKNSFNEALNHPAIYSRMSGFNSLCHECRACEYLNNCGGGYIPHRYSSENGFINPSIYCKDLKYLFAKIRKHLQINIPINVQSN
jgi:uncharacterized protein